MTVVGYFPAKSCRMICEGCSVTWHGLPEQDVCWACGSAGIPTHTMMRPPSSPLDVY